MASQLSNKFDKYHFEVPEGETSGMRLDKYLAAAIDDTSRTKIQKAIENKTVTVNGESKKSSYNIEAGDLIDVKIPIPKPPTAEAEDIPLDIVYEDDDLIIVNKSADMVVHPAPGNWSGTLVNALLWHTDELSDPDTDMIRPGIVHRLDKDTTGLLVVAKNDATHRKLSSYFQTKDIERTYQAIVWGNPDKESGTITGNIGRNPNNRKKMTVLSEGNGKTATTHYKVIESFDHLSLLELTLETGRTHQIRVHLADNNLWVFGDHKYGGRSVRYGSNTGSRRQMFNNLFKSLNRQCLHAKSLAFEHPGTGTMMDFESPLADDFMHVLTMLRQNCQPDHIY